MEGKVPINVFYESQFASFFKSYTNAINKQEVKRQGGLFKAKFKRTVVSDKEQFLYFLCYIHHNPIHHNCSINYEDWKHCSYSLYVELSSEKLLSISPVLSLFSCFDEPTGVVGFKKEHQRFKSNFSK